MLDKQWHQEVATVAHNQTLASVSYSWEHVSTDWGVMQHLVLLSCLTGGCNTAVDDQLICAPLHCIALRNVCV